MPRNCYPWVRWFKTPKRLLKHGRDYSSSTSTMAQIVRNNASRLGISVSVTEVDGGLEVVVTGRKTRRAI